MLCVSMDEEIPEVSENVVKAITGQSVCLNFQCDCISLKTVGQSNAKVQ